MVVLTIAVLAGLVIGLLLGALGGGGSILTVPVLVYALGQSTGAATTASLVIVGTTAITAVVGHARRGRVRWGTGLAFGLIGTATALLGSVLSRHVPSAVLLLAFAALMLVAAAAMTRRGSLAPPPGGARSRRARIGALVGAALVVGLLTGFLGVGGGFVIVPVLALVLQLPVPVAIGTSLLVIALTSAAGLVARWGHVDVAWHVVVPFTIAAVVASLWAGRATDRVPAAALQRAFTTLLVAVALYVATRALLAL